MSNFSQWWKSFNKSGPKQFTWVCGTEPVLVHEVSRLVRSALSPSPWSFFPLDAKEDSAESIWSEILQYPLSPGPRLIEVRHADLLDRERLKVLLKNRRLYPDNYVVFISSDERIPKEDAGDRKTQRPDYLRAFSGKGDVVECGPFTQATAQTAVDWVLSFRPMRRGVAAHLLERANGDLRLARDLSRKLAVFEREPTIASVNELLREHPRDTFAHALLALDKKTALLALEELKPSEYSSTLGALDANLELAGLVHDMLVARKPTSEISKAAGSRRFLVPEIVPVAKHYNPKRRSSIRKVLSASDEALNGGESLAVMEFVVAFW